MVAALNFITLDLETSGLDPRTDRIIEIGCVVVRDGVAGPAEAILVNPDRTLPPKITEITGLTQKDVDSGESVGAALSWLAERTAGAEVWVGHNILAFDLGFLMWEASRAGRSLALPPGGLRDTGVLYLAHRMGMRPYEDESHTDFAARVMERRPRGMSWNLAFACAEMGVPAGPQRHRAAGDALLCWRLYEALPALEPVERPRVKAAVL